MGTARAAILALPPGDDRRWSSAGAEPKPLVPVATRPIVFHVLDELRDAGVGDVVLVARPGAAGAFRHAVGDGRRWAMRIAHHTARGGTGLGEALATAAGGQGLIVHQADAMLQPRLREHLAGFEQDGLDALALNVGGGAVARAPEPVAAGYLLSPRAVSLLRDGSDDRDPLTWLRCRGGRVRTLDVEGCLACHGDEAGLLAANRHALAGLRTEVGDALLEDSELQGDVVIHPTATLRGTLVRGPAIIGAGSQLVDSYVGPYTSIGADVRLQGTEVEHSIVMDGATLRFVGTRIETSIIGRGASVVRRFDLPSAVRLSIGDGAEVAL